MCCIVINSCLIFIPIFTVDMIFPLIFYFFYIYDIDLLISLEFLEYTINLINVGLLRFTCVVRFFYHYFGLIFQPYMNLFFTCVQPYMNLGSMLTKEVGYELYPYVMLIDPALNQFEVVVDKKNGKLCFTHGLVELQRAYDLKFGGWITLNLICIQPKLFLIQVKDRHDVEVKYPQHVPLLVLKLDRNIFGSDGNPGFAAITV